MSTPARAIVALEPGTGPHEPGSNWFLQDIEVPTDLKAGELLVEMLATGICHSDLILTSTPPDTTGGYVYPRIAGHEGSGYIRAIGQGVSKDVNVGDPVLLSFDYCSDCESCKNKHPSYCASFAPLNIIGAENVFRTKEGKSIAGKCFGQSSFASLSVVDQACVLPAKYLIRGNEELKLFAPLGCGIQTGAGSMLNLARPRREDRVMVLGLGGVGLSAVMVSVTPVRDMRLDDDG